MTQYDAQVTAEKEQLEYEEELRRRVQNHLPMTVWEKEFDELYEVCAMHSKKSEIKHEAWQASLGFERMNRNQVRKNVVAIQVSIGPSGGYYGVWVPVADIDPDIDFITLYNGPKFSLMDLSALFNKYFREEGFEPGFYVDCNRDSLRLKGLVEWVPPRFPGDTEPPSNSFRLTDRGRAKAESLLEYHSKVYRRMEPAEMFFPRPGGVKRCQERRVLSERQQSLKPYGDCQSLIYDEIEREVRASHKKKEDST